MSNLLRRPAAVPALFSPGVEADRCPEPPPAASRAWSGAPALAILPALVLATEFPLMRCAADLLRLALPH